MRVLLITPPMIQLNTPYPATPYLTSYLRAQGYDVQQKDMSLDFALRVFSPSGLAALKNAIEQTDKTKSHVKKNKSVQFFLNHYEEYISTIDHVIDFLKGKNGSLALRICQRNLLPEGPRFMPTNEHAELLEAFGVMGTQDMAIYLSSLYIDDIADVIRVAVDADFQLSRYADQLASSQISFSPLYDKVKNSRTYLDEIIYDLTKDYVLECQPTVVGFTLPFPGNVYAALKSASYFKKLNAKIKIVAGGGFVNTELRELTDVRFFEFFDALTYDDGELPLERWLQYVSGVKTSEQLVRTKMLQMQRVVDFSSNEKNPPFKNQLTPTYSGLRLSDYISMLELPNPVHRLWSSFRWNKLILAHGCYWKKCTFCDVHLDYIGRFEPQAAKKIVDQMEQLIKETGSSGFHFVDEAAPPALLKAMSEEIIKRKLNVTFWGNIRFDKQFTQEVCDLLARAGLIAVTGGLEVASERVLKLINKGVTLPQVRAVTKSFMQAGVYVHAYLMYGFPSQTQRETMESLNTVRELFLNENIQSAHWHKFVATYHSPVGRQPEKYGIKLKAPKVPKEGVFAKYSVDYMDSVKTNNDRLGIGLKKALYNYMHGIGLEQPVEDWF